MDSKELLQKVLSVNEKIAATGSQTLVPCLIGPSGCGKSTTVEMLAKELKMPAVRLLLSTMLDIEILGLPRVIDGVTQWTKPEWLLDKPFILFLDELDKVRPDEVGAILTLLAEKRVRNYFLPEGSIIIAAMQPVDPVQWEGSATFEALQNRLVFIRMTASAIRQRLNSIFGVEASYINFEDFPVPIPHKLSGRVAEYGLRVLQFTDEEIARKILSGCMRSEYIEAIISDFKASIFTTARIAEAIKKNPNLIDQLTIPELIEAAGEVFVKCRPEIYGRLLERVYKEGSEDETEALREKVYNHLNELWDSIPDSKDKYIEVCDGASVEDVIVMINETARRIGEYWESQRKEASNGNQ